MARAISNGKILFAILSDGIVWNSRGFSSSTRVLREEKAVLKAGMKKSGTATSDAAAAPMAWVPDPVTGYYRPANRLRDTDPAELRQIFLKNKE